MPCLGPADIERVAADGLLNVPGAAAHVAGCADCAAAIGAAIRAHRTDDAPAEQIGRYQILGERGRGAFGRVYEAYDPALDRRVAIKLIAFTRDASPDALSELLREAKAMAQIQHANVVPIFDAGRADDAVFITMAIVDGETLDVWAAKQRAANTLDADRVLVSLGRRIAAGLAAIHAAGFVHRDIKPSNLLVAGSTAFVADLGLARRTTRATKDTDAFTGSELLSSMHTVSFAGTPAYMAPECLGGEAATPAADQYALAASLVEVITGHRPFDARTYWALHEAARTKPPRLDGVPKRYQAALARALHPDPTRRFASVTDFASALVAAARPTSGTWRIAVLAIVPALVVGAGWWWTTRTSSAPSSRDDAGATDIVVTAIVDATVVDATVVDAAVIDATVVVGATVVDAPHLDAKTVVATVRPATAHPARATSDAAVDAPPDKLSPVVMGSAPITCPPPDACRASYLRCTDATAARLATFDQARKRGWADCLAANASCTANSGTTCAADLTRCNATVAAAYERGGEQAERDDTQCLATRNACLACN